MKSLEEILKSSGLSSATARASGGALAPETATAPLPDEEELCDRCGGAGFVRKAVRFGHPDFGKAFPCECTQNEREDQRLLRLQRYSNLGPLSRLTFDNLSPRGRSPDAAHQELFAEAAKAAQQFARNPSRWIVFTGPSGCGKTHLAAAIAGHCIDAGVPALFMVVPDLLDHLRSTYQPNSPVAYDDLFELVRTAPVLILDDLGVQSSTSWAEEKLFQLINHRYNAQLPTVFTTDLELDDFDTRIKSRLTDAALSQVYSLESGASAALSTLNALGLPHLQQMTFSSFDPRRCAANPAELKEIENAYREAMKFAKEPANWFAIAGRSGKGKTRLAAAIGNFCAPSGQQVLFVVVPDLLDRLRAGYGPQNPGAFDKMFDQVRTIPLLILDDLGAESGTSWADEKLFQLINYRYNACLPTVFTTSATLNELPSRVATRLMDIGVTSLFLIGDNAGDFDFFGTHPARATVPPRGRGRPPRRA
jgi:DNA replication protein DnaC